MKEAVTMVRSAAGRVPAAFACGVGSGDPC